MTFEPIPEQEDRVPGRPIATVVLATIAAIIACAGVVWITTAFVATGGGASAVEVVDRIPPSAPFSFETTPEAVRAAERAEVDRWIDGAIDQYLEARR